MMCYCNAYADQNIGFLHNNDKKIYMKSTLDGTIIEFPFYLKEISLVIKRFLRYTSENNIVISVNFPSPTIELLAVFVRLLPYAARNDRGNSSPMQNIYQVTETKNVTQITILVNSLVYDVTLSKMHTLSKQEAFNLLKLVNHLTIPSLINALSRYMAGSITNNVKDELNKQDMSKTLTQSLLEAVRMVIAGTSTNGVLSDEIMTRIAKYTYLELLGINEKTVADYIGLNGLPIVTHNQLTLREDLTGISGIELISNGIKHMDLSKNYLLGKNLDLDFPESPFIHFRKLQRLNLSENELTTLPRQMFYGLENLEALHLYTNQITNLPTSIFHELKNLRALNLYENQLNSLPSEMFKGLMKLEVIRLHNNHISSLSPGIFDGLTSLSYITISYNYLPLSKQQFRLRHSIPSKIGISYYPQLK